MDFQVVHLEGVQRHSDPEREQLRMVKGKRNQAPASVRRQTALLGLDQREAAAVLRLEALQESSRRRSIQEQPGERGVGERLVLGVPEAATDAVPVLAGEPIKEVRHRGLTRNGQLLQGFGGFFGFFCRLLGFRRLFRFFCRLLGFRRFGDFFFGFCRFSGLRGFGDFFCRFGGFRGFGDFFCRFGGFCGRFNGFCGGSRSRRLPLVVVAAS